MGKKTGMPIRVSASGVVFAKPGSLIGFLCNSSSAGTVTLYDHNTGAIGTPFVDALAAGAGDYRAIPANCSRGLYVVIGGTCNVTFFIDV